MLKLLLKLPKGLCLLTHLASPVFCNVLLPKMIISDPKPKRCHWVKIIFCFQQCHCRSDSLLLLAAFQRFCFFLPCCYSLSYIQANVGPVMKAIFLLNGRLCPLISRPLFYFAAVRCSLGSSETDRQPSLSSVLLFMDARVALLHFWAVLLVLLKAEQIWSDAAGEVYTNTWAVQIIGGQEEADRVARKHGFINHGIVSLSHTVCTVSVCMNHPGTHPTFGVLHIEKGSAPKSNNFCKTLSL